MIRKAKAVWRGTGRAGSGDLSTESAVLAQTPYSFCSRFDNEKGTNPEELIAAAHAGCFTMALAFGLQSAGFTPTELSTEAAVTLESEGEGFRISRSALTLRANVPTLDEATFAHLAGEAEKNCPVSKVLNATITLDAKPTGFHHQQMTGIVAHHQSDQLTFRSILPEAVDWQPFPAFPPPARLAILVGHPSEPGPYVIRVKVPAGTRLMPHKHPEDRIYTVMSGVFYIGLGEAFDGEKVKAYPPGSVIVLPGETWHFHWAKSGEYVTQVTAIGPLGLEYHDPADDPRKQGLHRS